MDIFDQYERHEYQQLIIATMSEGNTWSGRQAGAESANAIVTSC
jgi:hypothetical protein